MPNIIISSKLPFDNLDVAKVYLFGSSIKGQGNDFDLLIISDDFEGMSRTKRSEKVKINFLDKIVDPVCLTSAEFNRLSSQNSIFLIEILKTAILFYERPNN